MVNFDSRINFASNPRRVKINYTTKRKTFHHCQCNNNLKGLLSLKSKAQRARESEIGQSDLTHTKGWNRTCRESKTKLWMIKTWKNVTQIAYLIIYSLNTNWNLGPSQIPKWRHGIQTYYDGEIKTWIFENMLIDLNKRSECWWMMAINFNFIILTSRHVRRMSACRMGNRRAKIENMSPFKPRVCQIRRQSDSICKGNGTNLI